MQVVVLYGESGTGKSWTADAMAPDAFRLPPQQSHSGTGWWDGYDGESDIIIDEFYGQLRWSFMLQLLDRYPLRVESKGGSVNFVGRRLIFTSNKAPWDWYDREKVVDQTPLKRRVSKVWHFTFDYRHHGAVCSSVSWP